MLLVNSNSIVQPYAYGTNSHTICVRYVPYAYGMKYAYGTQQLYSDLAGPQAAVSFGETIDSTLSMVKLPIGYWQRKQVTKSGGAT